MSRSATIFLLIMAPGLAVLLVFLGLQTLPSNFLGWFLLLVGIVYTVGILVDAYVRKNVFWGPKQSGDHFQEERGDRSFWPIALGIMVAFFLSPLEYLYFAAITLCIVWLDSIGPGLVILGSILFVWARRTLGANYSGHVSVKKEQELLQNGPYQIVRHPAYAGYLFIALGLALGYSSLLGFASTLLILLPAIVYRIRVEDRMLAEHFGAQFEQYTRKKKRLIPGVW